MLRTRCVDLFSELLRYLPTTAKKAVRPAENLLSIRMDALYHLHAMLVDFGDKLVRYELELVVQLYEIADYSLC